MQFRLGSVSIGILAVIAACASRKAGDGFGDVGDAQAGADARPPSLGNMGDAVPGCVSSPENFEIPDNGCDDDGDGEIDNVPSCDANLGVSGSADDFARALGLCAKGGAGAWGVVSASYTSG